MDLYAGHHLRALRHVRRHALLGEYRSAGLWPGGDAALGADRPEPGEPDDAAFLAHGPRLRAEADRDPRPIPRDGGGARRPASRFLGALGAAELLPGSRLSPENCRARY